MSTTKFITNKVEEICDSEKEYSITITGDILEYELQNCNTIKNVIIDGSVTSIGRWSFAGCENLNLIEIKTNENGEGVETIDTSTFQGCTNLKKIIFPESLKEIKTAAFSNCGFDDIEIPINVTNIEALAFASCENLTSVTILGDNIEIKNTAFYNCTNLTNVKILGYNTQIKVKAFENCNKITDIDIPSNITNIFKNNYTSLKTVIIRGYNTDIPAKAFQDFKLLEKVTINGVNSIGDSAFDKCIELKTVTIEDGLTNIGDEVFSNCTKLDSIEIPESVTIIGDAAFIRCKNLQNLKIKKGVVEIGMGAFYKCDKLQKITIPSSVNTIGKYAFCKCILLKNVNIEEGVKYILDNAFSECTNLDSIKIPNSVEIIGDEVFSNCTKLDSIEIPDSLIIVGENVFEGCENLKKIINYSDKFDFLPEEYRDIEIKTMSGNRLRIAYFKEKLYFYQSTSLKLNKPEIIEVPELKNLYYKITKKISDIYNSKHFKIIDDHANTEMYFKIDHLAKRTLLRNKISTRFSDSQTGKYSNITKFNDKEENKSKQYEFFFNPIKKEQKFILVFLDTRTIEGATDTATVAGKRKTTLKSKKVGNKNKKVGNKSKKVGNKSKKVGNKSKPKKNIKTKTKSNVKK